MPAPAEDSLATRRTLLSRLRDLDDASGWRQFFDRYWRLIYNVARKAGLGDADAQDLVQDVLVSLAKKMPNFRYDPARGRFKNFLLTVVHSRLVEFFRRGAAKRACTVAFDEDTPEPPAGEAQLEAVWDEEWRRTLLEAALARVQEQVSARQFLLFDLAVVRGTPVAEICRAMNVRAPVVYMAKLRVRRLVEKELKRLEAGK